MTDDAIDQSTFAELQDATGADFAAELLTTFLDEAPQMIADLRDAAAEGDEDRLRRAAHSIKSNANIFGATALAQIARAIELEGLSENSLGDLAAEYAQTETALKAMLDG